MAEHVHQQSQERPRPRPRRWPIAVAAGAVLLAAYGSALLWFSTRLGDEIQGSMQQAPVVEDTRHSAE